MSPTDSRILPFGKTQHSRSCAGARLMHVRALLPPFLAPAIAPLSAAAFMLAMFLPASPRATGQSPLSLPQDSSQSQGQTPETQQPAQITGDSGLVPNPASELGSSAGIAGASSMALPAGQIIGLLERNPDLAVELKSLVAGRLVEQGTQIDANDITDQMLYDQIATNPALRAGITTFLRARGYITEDDLAASMPSSGDIDSSASGGTVVRAPAFGNAPDSSSLGEAGALGVDPLSSRDSAPLAASQQPLAQQRSRMTPQEPRSGERTNASTDAPQVLRRPAPYNLRSMRDLYTQIPDQSAQLKRFGSQVFLTRSSSAVERGAFVPTAPLDAPVGPDYVLGPGDTLQIDLWGGVTQRLSRAIGGDGRVLLPEAGSFQVAGLTLERAQSLIEGALKPQYRNAQIAVTVSRLRSVRVYIVGDVQRPGGYDISSLATAISALYAAGGPTSTGSLRLARHLRGEQVVEEIDLYDFLLHGIRNTSARFESGDTLLVPPVGAQVAISGAIKRPAIYELKPDETSLATVIDDAGGLTAAASLSHVVVERVGANRKRETVTLAITEDGNPDSHRDAIRAFPVADGDRIRVEPILPYSQRAVYLEGHVVRPGRVAYTDGMRLADVLRSYRDLLPEPSAHGEVVRLVAPDLHAETIEFSIPDLLIGNANVDLQPFDTIRIFGRYEVDAPKVTIRGEVLRPGAYPLSNGMTAAQLVRMAGGFKRDALLDGADLASYDVTAGNQIAEAVTSVRIGAAVSGAEPSADAPLKAGDVLSIHQITGWNDIGESVTIEGQVRYPGSYGFKDGERLSSVLRRAGGLLDTAYPTGAILVRDQVRDLELKSRDELIRQIETSSAAARLSPNLGGSDPAAMLQMIKAQQEQVIADLKSHPPAGRMVIHIAADIDSWANTPADVELRQGDTLTIPKRPGFVLVTGQVYNATALTFTPGKTASWYLSRAGGTSTAANRKEVFIIRANGSVVSRHSAGFFEGNVLSTKLDPGDVVVVPQKIVGTSQIWRNLLTTAQLASSIAITASVASL